jgi:hypothetical protein
MDVREAGRRGALATNKKLSKKKRSASARKAARAPWGDIQSREELMIRSSAEESKAVKARKRELRAILLTGDTSRQSESAKKAIAYCDLCIKEYEEWFDWNEHRWLFFQKVMIIGGVVATLAGVITIPDSWIASIPWVQSFGWVRGVPAGIVTIAAGYLSSFTYREDAVRHESTATALWSELARYQGHAKPYDKNDADDTSVFVNNLCRLVENETHNWSALVMGNKSEIDSRKDNTLLAETPKKDEA